MSTGYQIKDQEAAYYVTFQIVEWVDVFSRKIYRDIVIDSLRYCQEHKKLEIYAYVIMSNHMHLLVRSGKGELSATIRDFKRHTSKAIIHAIIEGNESRKEWMLNIFSFAAKKHSRNENYQVWTHENHAEEVFSNKFIWQKVLYIHENPVRNGLVHNSWEYKYSSASNYADMDSILDIICVTRPLKTY